MYETIRIVKKVKPKYILWENVKNLVSDKHIYNFRKYLDAIAKMGYNNYYSILNSNNYGIPQGRDRIFTLSIRDDIDDKQFEFPLKQVLKNTYKDYLEENYLDYNIQILLKPNHLKRLKGHQDYEVDYGFGGKLLQEDDKEVPTIVSEYGISCGNGCSIKCKEGCRRLTPRECWRLMRFYR